MQKLRSGGESSLPRENFGVRRAMRKKLVTPCDPVTLCSDSTSRKSMTGRTRSEMKGYVRVGGTVVGTFSIKFDGAVLFTMKDGSSLGETLTRVRRHGMSVDLILDPESMKEVG
jgi:hypothetical protein